MNFEKLSINIQLFRTIDVENSSFINQFTEIKLMDNEQIDLNPVVFFNNRGNLNYFLGIFLIYAEYGSENRELQQVRPLGDFMILNQDKFRKRFNNVSNVGIFDGTFGTNVFNFKEIKLKKGRYEIAIIGKTVEEEIEDKEIESLREKFKKCDIQDYLIYTSYPFNIR